MSNAKDNGGCPVYPITDKDIPGRPCFGLTKREYFAGLAMQGMLADTRLSGPHHECGEQAVKFADALLEALETNNV